MNESAFQLEKGRIDNVSNNCNQMHRKRHDINKTVILRYKGRTL